MALVLDSSAVSYLARRTPATLALITALRDRGVWPPLVPSPVLIECLTGDGSRDAATHRLLRSVNILEAVPVGLARRAAHLRTEARPSTPSSWLPPNRVARFSPVTLGISGLWPSTPRTLASRRSDPAAA